MASEPTTGNDPVACPAHYVRDGAVEPLVFIQSHGMSFCAGNVIKYVTRYKHKGSPVQDLKKARAYLDRLIAEEEQKEPKATLADFARPHKVNKVSIPCKPWPAPNNFSTTDGYNWRFNGVEKRWEPLAK